ncbi:MAG: cation:proton antiporter [Nanoarchaeota archaeon]|nr:cation:proton antiporter [Nanoarchaeota archaeon]MBU1622619.1 cation:proton antiporter [Nanoarchaeota archaeon]
MDVVAILMAVSLILFFGFFAGFLFRKIGVPDILFLIILGFIIGPFALDYVRPEMVVSVAPVFTTFTLLFLLFDGAFNINLSSLVREFSESFVLTAFNFFISSVLVGIIMFFILHLSFGLAVFESVLIALLTGFLLGGVSSAFVIPVLQQLNIKKRLYSLLALESALTDVFCIVFSIAVISVFELGGFGLKTTVIQLISQFAIAGTMGVIGGIIWIILILRVFKMHNYMMTIAYLLFIYVITEYMGGNGAIAALFFGLMLNNSKQLSSIVRGIVTKKAKEKQKALKGDLGVSVTTPSEEFFYHQISFFLKVFFFVYIGVLIDISNWKALVVGGILSFLLMGSRVFSRVLTKGFQVEDRSLVDSIFARGLAAAAIAQLALQAGLPAAEFIVKVAFVTITGTIILSSIRVFLVKRKLPALEEKKSLKAKKKLVLLND